MDLLWCSFFVTVNDKGLYEFAKDFLVPIGTISGSIWGAFEVAKRQIVNQKNSDVKLKSEKEHIIRDAYLNSLALVKEQMKVYKESFSELIIKIDDYDYSYNSFKCNSTGAFVILAMDYKELYESFTPFFLYEKVKVGFFINSYQSIYGFSVDLEQLQLRQEDFIKENHSIKDILHKQFLSIMDKISLMIHDQSLSNELKSIIASKFEFLKKPSEDSNNMFKDYFMALQDISRIIVDVKYIKNRTVFELFQLLNDVLTNFSKLEAQILILKSNLEIVINNIDFNLESLILFEDELN